MATFVQIGDRAFNPDWITSVHFDTLGWDENEPETNVWFGAPDLEGPQAIIFKGTEAEAFKAWWENHADVYVVPTVSTQRKDWPYFTTPT